MSKTGGRTAGTPNKLTFQTRQILVNALGDELENLPDLLSKLEPYQRIDAICKLLKFALPQMGNVLAFAAEKHSLMPEADKIEDIERMNAKDRMFI